MKENCYALRPGTILGYKGRSWKVAAHDTLSRRITIRTTDEPTETKAFTYEPGQEIEIRWKPDTRI